MNDYKLIRRDPSYSKLRSIDTYLIHQVSIKWLENSLASSVTKQNIVITHHAPSIQSIPIRYREDVEISAYGSYLESFILTYQPDYWIHGHIYEPSAYTIGNTKIICNPHGYIHEQYQGFNPELIIDM